VGRPIERRSAEDRFAVVFEHLANVTAYARRRGSRDPEGIAAEAMTIAWRRLADVPADDPRPWLYATARNLVYAEYRAASRLVAASRSMQRADEPAYMPQPEARDSAVTHALGRLSPADREALLLVAWEDLTPTLAAASLGISAVAFRVRFHRARKRFEHALSRSNPPAAIGPPRMEKS